MLSEWVRYYHQPGMFKEGDKIYAAYVARVMTYNNTCSNRYEPTSNLNAKY